MLFDTFIIGHSRLHPSPFVRACPLICDTRPDVDGRCLATIHPVKVCLPMVKESKQYSTYTALPCPRIRIHVVSDQYRTKPEFSKCQHICDPSHTHDFTHPTPLHPTLTINRNSHDHAHCIHYSKSMRCIITDALTSLGISWLVGHASRQPVWPALVASCAMAAPRQRIL